MRIKTRLIPVISILEMLALVAIMFLIPKVANEPETQKEVVNKDFADPVNDSGRL